MTTNSRILVDNWDLTSYTLHPSHSFDMGLASFWWNDPRLHQPPNTVILGWFPQIQFPALAVTSAVGSYNSARWIKHQCDSTLLRDVFPIFAGQKPALLSSQSCLVRLPFVFALRSQLCHWNSPLALIQSPCFLVAPRPFLPSRFFAGHNPLLFRSKSNAFSSSVKFSPIVLRGTQKFFFYAVPQSFFPGHTTLYLVFILWF